MLSHHWSHQARAAGTQQAIVNDLLIQARYRPPTSRSPIGMEIHDLHLLYIVGKKNRGLSLLYVVGRESLTG